MVIYQIFEALTVPNEEQYIRRCTETSMKWLRYMGFVRFHGNDGLRSAVTILPEIIAFVASHISFVVVVLFSHRAQEVEVPGTVRPVRMNNDGKSEPCLLHSFPAIDSELRVLLSVSFCCELILLFFAAFHILAIYIYQIPIVQEILPGESILARIIGLSAILLTDCQRWWKFWVNDNLQLPAMINPLFLLVFYHVLMVQLLWTYNGSRDYVDDNDGESSVHEERLNAGNDRADDNAALSPHGSRPLLPPDGEDVHFGETGQAIPLRKVTSQIVDRHRIGQIFGTAENPATIAASKGMVAIFSFALYHAYTFALLAMMTWALLYHSIFGLLLLVLACTLWMFKDSRGASFAMAPSITVYVEFLLLAQYACSMNVTSSELQLPDWLKMVGIMIASNMWSGFVTLSVKLLLSLPVFLLLRLSIRETFYESLSEHERVRRIQNYGTFHDKDPAVPVGTTQGRRDRAAGFVHWLSLQFTKCSIFLVALVLLVVACQPHPVLYTIGFFCIWCLLVIYFKFPEVWTRWTGLDKKWNDDIGLINYSDVGESGALFARLFTPISLFVVAMLQLKFFHDPWMAMMTRTSEDRGEVLVDREPSISARIGNFVNRAVELIWRITEIHITKIVFIIVTVFAANNKRVFPLLNMDDFDLDLVHAMQFLVDFGFYKFGFELCMIMMAINAWVRMDMLATVMCIWIGLFALNKRSVSRKLWYIFVTYLAVLFPLQYVIYVGLPEDSCLG
ncbi:unnamed protein product [Angiostrongylus costaricensis]|uniref:XK-related protein n=1 Tax=Angiostrongylus costaricensis TaxID=334426 RepID=A0A158PIP0_ANGCS|nr:unnamed protein product [Angiostrongylus costaricensis]